MISIHALREEGDRDPMIKNLYLGISIHALREEGDRWLQQAYNYQSGISIHALREEGDPSKSSVPSALCDFNPRPPRGGRHMAGAEITVMLEISIHALREEGDNKNKKKADAMK